MKLRYYYSNAAYDNSISIGLIDKTIWSQQMIKNIRDFIASIISTI